jgi:hypothetical protein
MQEYQRMKAMFTTAIVSVIVSTPMVQAAQNSSNRHE